MRVSPEAPKAPELIGIVAEGGGQRGIFTAGVLDAFLQQQFNPFQLGIGVSAGAQNLLSFWLGEPGYARRSIEELTTRPGFFVPYRWLMAKSVVDLDNYFRRVESDPQFRLPLEQFDPLVRAKPLLFVATSKPSGEPVYLQPTAANVIQCLKASSAVPFLYQQAVCIDGVELFDGGASDPLPVQQAFEMGASKILVVRTLPGRVFGSSWREHLQQALKKQRLNPQLALMLQNHERRFERAIDFIFHPPTGVSVLELSPPEPLRSQTFGSTSEELLHDYELGVQAGLDTVAEIRHWLAAERE